MNCCAFFLCLHCDNNFTFDFFLLAVWQVRSFLSLFLDCSFCVRTFHYLEQLKMLVRKIIMTPSIELLSSNVIFTKSLFCDSLACAFSQTRRIDNCMHTQIPSLSCVGCARGFSLPVLSRPGLSSPFRMYSLRSFAILLHFLVHCQVFMHFLFGALYVLYFSPDFFPPFLTRAGCLHLICWALFVHTHLLVPSLFLCCCSWSFFFMWRFVA